MMLLKEFRYIIIIEKEKDIRHNKGEIYAHNNVSKKSA